MGIALTLQQYLDDHHVDYDVMMHKRTHCAFDTARASHVPGERLAKAVVLTREGGFVVAVVPARRRAPRYDRAPPALPCRDRDRGRDRGAVPRLRAGAVPPIPEAYAVDAFIDVSFDEQPDVYLEGGDHRSLVHISGEQFRALMQDVRHARIAASVALDRGGLVEMRHDEREDVGRGVLAEDAVDVP